MKLIDKIVRRGNSSDLLSKRLRLRKSKTIDAEKNKSSSKNDKMKIKKSNWWDSVSLVSTQIM